jgi:hypothetical protein
VKWYSTRSNSHRLELFGRVFFITVFLAENYLTN